MLALRVPGHVGRHWQPCQTRVACFGPPWRAYVTERRETYERASEGNESDKDRKGEGRPRVSRTSGRTRGAYGKCESNVSLMIHRAPAGLPPPRNNSFFCPPLRDGRALERGCVTRGLNTNRRVSAGYSSKMHLDRRGWVRANACAHGESSLALRLPRTMTSFSTEVRSLGARRNGFSREKSRE